jgi:hypothetical protein
VPISIPDLQALKKASAENGAGGEWCSPQAFIPPHKLSQQSDFMLALPYAAASVNMNKKDRLRVRNTVLKSTGMQRIVKACVHDK